MTTASTILITGAAKRLGQATAITFAHKGCNLVIHYNQSKQQAQLLQQKIHQINPDSCEIVQADLSSKTQYQQVVECALDRFGRLDHLINNASVFFPTPILQSSEEDFSGIWKTNFLAPKQLAEYAAPFLKKCRGSIVNLIDIYAVAGLSEHSLYVASKAALREITQMHALKFAPHIRVNGVAPGAILWPDENADLIENSDDTGKAQILAHSALKRLGQASNIAATIVYLALQAHYTTGEIINVDGGRRDYI